MNNSIELIKELELQKCGLEATIIDAQQKIKEINRQLNYLRKGIGDIGLLKDWNSFIISCIACEDNFLTTTEILSTAIPNDSDLNALARRNHIMNISLRLNRLVQAGRLYKELNQGTKGYLYGLAEWREGNEWKPYYKQKLEMKRYVSKNKENDFFTEKRYQNYDVVF